MLGDHRKKVLDWLGKVGSGTSRQAGVELFDGSSEKAYKALKWLSKAGYCQVSARADHNMFVYTLVQVKCVNTRKRNRVNKEYIMELIDSGVNSRTKIMTVVGIDNEYSVEYIIRQAVANKEIECFAVSHKGAKSYRKWTGTVKNPEKKRPILEIGKPRNSNNLPRRVYIMGVLQQ